MYKLPKHFFVSGTDTDVGKTMVSAILTLGLKTHYWKPIQCGCDPSADGDWLAKMGVEKTKIYPERYRLANPLSPHRAAELEGVSIKLTDFEKPTEEHSLIVEGAGGLLVPINEHDMVIDLANHLKLPVLLVARSGLGTINHTLMSILTLKQKGAELLGVIMNGDINPSNKHAIEHYGQTQVLAELPRLSDPSPASLKQAFEMTFAERLCV